MSDWRPYKDKTDEWLINEYAGLDYFGGMFWYIGLALLFLTVLWRYFRVAFYVTVGIMIFVVIVTLKFDNKYDKKKLIEKELKYRRLNIR